MNSNLTKKESASIRTYFDGDSVRWGAEFRTAMMVAHRELLRFVRARGRLLSSFVQPLTFLVIFGFGLNRLVAPSGGVDFVQFVLPGVITMTVVIASLTSCILVVWDREFGFLREMLVAPPHRISLVVGRMAGAALIGTAKGVIILLLAPIIGIELGLTTFFVTIPVVMLMAVAGTAIGMFLVSWIRRMESFSAIMSFVMLPMMFLSGAFFPIKSLPVWLAVPIHLNPLTYAVDALRRVVLGGQTAGVDSAGLFTAGVELFGRTVPVAVELAFVAGLALLFAWLATLRFGKAE